ncbi:MAG: glucosamine-6-phosphate deaminase, partial [Promethearchaeota archaeon]
GIGPLFVRKMIIMEDWENINLRAEIEEATGIPTFVENDANVIGLGEKEISRIEGDLITLTIGESVGGGIIINNRILHGENDFAGELGHVIIDDTKDAQLCGCGNRGCLEAYVSSILKQAGRNIDADILDKIAKGVAKAIEIIVNLTGINQVLVGSSVTKLGYQFYQTIREILKTTYVPEITPRLYESFLERFPEHDRKYIGAVGAAIMGMQKAGEIAEKVIVVINDDDNEMGKAAACIIADQIRRKPDTVLGLATGSTPISTYKELVRMHKEEGLDFSQVIAFNLDEYYPIKKADDQSYHTFMHHWLFNHVNIDPKNIHIPSGEIREEDIEHYCEEYEKLIHDAGGIDIQILGIGGSYYNDKGEIIGGHIGFNEAGSDFFSRTRKVVLADKTRIDNARFFKTIDEVPHYAITLGMGTILDARRIILLASGEHKAQIVKQAVEGKITLSVPASALQIHPNTTFLIEKTAASFLSRMTYPWLFFDIDWAKVDQQDIDNALIWISITTRKPLGQLDLQDFHNNFLSAILPLYNYNVPRVTNEVIKRINSKIAYKEGLPRNKRILIISLRPGDDAIIGDTVRALVGNKNVIKIVNLASGNINVKNSDAIDYCEQNYLDSSIKERILNNSIDRNELLQLKTLVRKAEAIDMHAYLGISLDNQMFLNLPFYDRFSSIEKRIISEADIEPLKAILNQEMPDIILILDGTRDPHGHKALSVEIFETALKKSRIKKTELWHYKTSMEEFSFPEADKIVPFTEKEIDLKIIATQRLKSQQTPILLGFDPRPLWERIKERNRNTGHILKSIGLVSEEYNYATNFKVSQYSTTS